MVVDTRPHSTQQLSASVGFVKVFNTLFLSCEKKKKKYCPNELSRLYHTKKILQKLTNVCPATCALVLCCLPLAVPPLLPLFLFSSPQPLGWPCNCRLTPHTHRTPMPLHSTRYSARRVACFPPRPHALTHSIPTLQLQPTPSRLLWVKHRG